MLIEFWIKRKLKRDRTKPQEELEFVVSSDHRKSLSCHTNTLAYTLKHGNSISFSEHTFIGGISMGNMILSENTAPASAPFVE